jgi:diaminopimelate epimerase
MTSVPFLKGHGTGNDFVLLPDHDASRFGPSVDPVTVRRLCDRRRGIGADGVIRVVRSAALPAAEPGSADWFMDYRNADGSPAEMCGNGIRVLARHLLQAGLVDPSVTPLAIATRAGTRSVLVCADGDLSVDMGPARPGLSGTRVDVGHPAASGPGTAVAMPNPHAVVEVGDLAAVGPLAAAPRVRPAQVFPEGANVEFVQRVSVHHLRMRVWERGVGETQSCGTGVCAAAWVAMREADAPVTYRVDVPGGTLHVTQDETGSLHLRGPAVIVAEGSVDLAALATP